MINENIGMKFSISNFSLDVSIVFIVNGLVVIAVVVVSNIEVVVIVSNLLVSSFSVF
jgi:hypothetical protein